MRFLKIFSLAVLINLSYAASAQTPGIQVLESGKKISIRGLSVVNDDVIWASGSKGSVARSTDGGKTFTWTTVPGYEKNDFRDIEAFDKNTALIMAITEPATILKTTDGGLTWKKVLEDTTKGAFFDAMDFADPRTGMLLGDPIQNRFYQAISRDGGDTWQQVTGAAASAYHYDSPTAGEAFFASSGTNLKMLGNHPIYVSGGKNSRLFFRPFDTIPLPIMKGKESTGANSIAVQGFYTGVIVGGDFTRDTISSSNCVLFNISADPITYRIPTTPPHGYRSCVVYLSRKKLLTCGTSGVDLSRDKGNNWELISKESYHVCQKAKKGKAVFLAGNNGRIAKLVW
ncbi:MAG: oxidoreductase [Bacteroidetes bacterium]|nr:oxidoreductase [Bacteroidota bacterium]